MRRGLVMGSFRRAGGVPSRLVVAYVRICPNAKPEGKNSLEPLYLGTAWQRVFTPGPTLLAARQVYRLDMVLRCTRRRGETAAVAATGAVVGTTVKTGKGNR